MEETQSREDVSWHVIARAVARPYRVTPAMLLLVSLVPLYLVIAARARGSVTHVPELFVDRMLPVLPASAIVYGALYAFLIVLPVLVVQQPDMIARLVRAYLSVWSISYAVFLVYPTVASRPTNVAGENFAAWGLRFLYGADPPYNCFPSIHVAHSFVSALVCYRVHRALGRVALWSASLVAVSTLSTKQHYVADVVVGAMLALAADRFFFRGYSRANVPAFDRQVAPYLAVMLAGVIGAAVLAVWIAYRFGALA